MGQREAAMETVVNPLRSAYADQPIWCLLNEWTVVPERTVYD